MATRLTQYRAVTPARVEQRSAPRHRVVLTHALLDNSPAEALLHDLSVYGCRLACTAPHAAGERLWVRIGAALPIAATVVWNDDDQLGCRFDAPIARSLVRSLTLVLC